MSENFPTSFRPLSCPACASDGEVTTAQEEPPAPCPACAALKAATPEDKELPPTTPSQGKSRRSLVVRTPAMPGSRLGQKESKEPPRLPKPGEKTSEEPSQASSPATPAALITKTITLKSPRVLAASIQSDPPISAGNPFLPKGIAVSGNPFSAIALPSALALPAAALAAVPLPSFNSALGSTPFLMKTEAETIAELPPAAQNLSASSQSKQRLKKAPFRQRMAHYYPLIGAALLCSAAVAAWRVWPASLYFGDLLEPSPDLLYHYKPSRPAPVDSSLLPTSAPRKDQFEEFAAEGFHFRAPSDYWERVGPVASPFSLLRPAFTLRRTDASPPSEFGVASCDFSVSTDILPVGTGVDDTWQNLPSIVALQARFSCGLPERYEVTTPGTQPSRFLRLVWDELPTLSGEPARQLEMWVQQRGRIAWSLTGLMPGTASSYALTRTMQRLARGFAPLNADPETIRRELIRRDTNGAAALFVPPANQPLYRWSALPAGTSTWPGGQWQVPGADTTWAIGSARLALITLPPDGLEKITPSRILTGLRQLWPALRGFSFPVIDPTTAPDGQLFSLLIPGVFEQTPAQCLFHWHRSPQGTVLAFLLQPETAAHSASDPVALLSLLDLTPHPPSVTAPSTALSAVHLPLLEILASDAQADGRPREAAALHFALFNRSQQLEDLAAACSCLAAGGQMEEAIRLFETGGARFSNTSGWELYHTLVLARLGAGPRAHRHAMDLLSSNRFPGSLAAPYLNALIESRSWPQAKTFASMLVRHEPDSAPWRLQYAAILAETKERPKAIAIIQATQQTWPDDATLGIECVRTLLRYNSPQEALALASLVALAHPDHEQAQLLLGQCQTMLGRPEEARLAYQSALKAAPSSQAARQAITSLATISAQSDTAFITNTIDPVSLPSVLTSGLPSIPPNTALPALILSRITGLRHQRGRPPATTVRTRIFIGNSEGMSQWNTLTFPIDPARERLALHSLNILSPEGKIIARGNPADRYTLDAPDGTRLVHFPVPGLVPGCTIDYAATTESLTPATTWAYTRHPFALTTPGLTDICYVVGDTSTLTWVHTQKQAPLQSGDALIWRQDQPALLSAPNTQFPTLHLGTVTATWETIGRSYLEQIRHRLTPDPSINALATRITADLPDRASKITALARRIRSDISYTAIEFGYRAIIPHAPALTLHNRFGDCKDHAVLLHSLLTAAGIPSYLALIHSTLSTHPSFPSLNQFDHMIVALPTPGGEFDFIDPTDKFLEPTPGCAPTGLTSRTALILDPANPRLANTPATEAPSTASLNRFITLLDEHDAHISDQITLTGPSAATLRAYLSPLPPASYLPALRRLLSPDPLRQQLLQATLTALRDPSAPLILALTWRAPDALRPAPSGQQLLLPDPLADYLLFPPALRDPDPLLPLILTTPLKLDTTLQIQVPPGYQLQPPTLSPPSGQRPPGTWNATADPSTLTWNAQLLAGTWNGPEAAAAVRFPSEALKPLRQPWLLTAPPRSIFTNLPPDREKLTSQK